jgi:putative oxidoreductase
MAMLRKLTEYVDKLTEKGAWAGPLLARITVGVVFAGTGWGKLHSLPDVTKFFTDLGLPWPGFQAGLVATTEFVGGVLLLVGLLTRLAAAPLAVTMVVAILTAKRSEIDGLSALLGLEEFLYLAVFVWLMLAGPGALSLDRLLGGRLKERLERAHHG